MTKVPLTRSLESLKREAKTIAKNKSCKLHEAQNELARRYGFENWALLHKHHPETLAKQSKTASVKPKVMRNWFLVNHEQDTFNPFDSDGIASPTVDVRLVLEQKFSTASPEVLDDVAEELEEKGDWVSVEVAGAINWFVKKHQLAVDCSPYESREGGYLYPLVDVFDVISNNFSKLPDGEVDRIVQAIESFDDAWVDSDYLTALYEDEDPSSAVDIKN